MEAVTVAVVAAAMAVASIPLTQHLPGTFENDTSLEASVPSSDLQSA